MRMSFEAWKALVNQEISKKTGMFSDDLPDWDYWSAWDSGMSYKTAANQAIRAGLYF